MKEAQLPKLSGRPICTNILRPQDFVYFMKLSPHHLVSPVSGKPIIVRSKLFVRRFPIVGFETVPVLIWLTMDLRAYFALSGRRPQTAAFVWDSLLWAVDGVTFLLVLSASACSFSSSSTHFRSCVSCVFTSACSFSSSSTLQILCVRIRMYFLKLLNKSSKSHLLRL